MDQLPIDSLLGQRHLRLNIAKPGARAYAFVADFKFRLLLTLAWVLAAAPLISYLELNGNDAVMLYGLVLPAATIYFGYHFVLEAAMKGSTPGKRLAGIRVVSLDGSPVSLGQVLIRNAFRIVDSLPSAYLTGLIATGLTRQHVRIGDLAAGTVLVHDYAAPSIDEALGQSQAPGHMPYEIASWVRSLLSRWTSLERGQRSALAREFLNRYAPAPSSAIERGSFEEDRLLRDALRRALKA